MMQLRYWIIVQTHLKNWWLSLYFGVLLTKIHLIKHNVMTHHYISGLLIPQSVAFRLSTITNESQFFSLTCLILYAHHLEHVHMRCTQILSNY